LWRSSKRGLATIINLSRAHLQPISPSSINPITMADTEDRAPTDTKAEAPQATTADPTAPPTADDIEAAVDVDTEMQTESSNTMDNAKSAANMDGASDDPPAVPQIETRMPAKKDVALRDFLSKMDEYAPIVSSLL
jgi:transcription initiation factor TFIID subunit 10